MVLIAFGRVRGEVLIAVECVAPEPLSLDYPCSNFSGLLKMLSRSQVQRPRAQSELNPKTASGTASSTSITLYLSGIRANISIVCFPFLMRSIHDRKVLPSVGVLTCYRSFRRSGAGALGQVTADLGPLHRNHTQARQRHERSILIFRNTIEDTKLGEDDLSSELGQIDAARRIQLFSTVYMETCHGLRAIIHTNRVNLNG